ncbi:MAG: hypothetical protein KDH84_06780 [Calditrichaeota bacterium]|nr:hypothetical protein [Calditrichota bacterium]MCB0312952.1 hypothetical protein [Calditrichota bacterium]
MKRFDKPPSFNELLAHCCRADSPYHEHAWKIFWDQYYERIFLYSTRSCRRWRLPRLNRQFSEVVKDVVCNVFASLRKGLHTYNLENGEAGFNRWLSTICINATFNYMKSFFESQQDEHDPANTEELHAKFSAAFRQELNSLGSTHRRELFEEAVALLRITNKQKRNLERNINIFYLNIWQDLPQETILAHPCLSGTGHRVIEVETHRMREIIRKFWGRLEK